MEPLSLSVIRHLIETSGESLEAISKRANVCPNTLISIRHGRKTPRQWTLARIARALDQSSSGSPRT